MAKQKPPGTVSHQIYLPEELHKQVTAIAEYGTADDLIVECVAEAMKPRWKRWLKNQMNKIQN